MINKPKVVVSRCLGFEICRWNGAAIENSIINDLRQSLDFITVCPECEIGLGVPRQPILMVQSSADLCLVQPATGVDLTDRMNSFSHQYLKSLGPVDGFLLKRKSPSCGLSKVPIFVAPDSEEPFADGSGFFARVVLERFPGIAVVDEAQLDDSTMRESWLKVIFNRARLRLAQYE